MIFYLLFIFILIQSKIYSQSVNWTVNIDINKDGFIDDDRIFKPKKEYTHDLFIDYEGVSFKRKSSTGEIDTLRVPIVFIKSNGKAILIWSDTKERITPQEYDQIWPIAINTYQVQIGACRGIIDSTANIVIPIKYATISSLDPSMFDKINGYEGSESYRTYETQLFQCNSYPYGARCNPKQPTSTDIINRRGELLMQYNNKSSNFQGVSYYVKDKTIYMMLGSSITILNKITYSSSIGKIWGKPQKFINLIYNSTGTENSVFKNPLIKTFQTEFEKYIVYDISKQTKIPNIQPFKIGYSFFDDFIVAEKKLTDYGDKTVSLIDNNLKVIIPFENNYETIEDFEPRDAVYSAHSRVGYFRIDSLLLISQSRRPHVGNKYGVFKIGFGELIQPKYQNIERLNSNLCIITNFGDNSKNVLSLKSLKLIFSYNYDHIYFIQNSAGKNYFECILDGKTELKYIE